MDFKEVNDKFVKATPLTDKELKFLIKSYSDLENKLDALGSHYHFAWLNVYENLELLKRYKEARVNPI